MTRRTGERVGYARISTRDQNPDIQLHALRKAGCKKVFVDKMGGSRSDRPQLKAARDYVRAGDTLVVWELSRFARSMEDFARWLRELRDSNVELKVIDLALDTRTPHGKFAAHVYVASAELQVEVIRWNVREGLARAVERGAVLGRLPTAPKTIRAIRSLARTGELSPTEIGAELGIHRATVYKYLNAPDSLIKDVSEIYDQHRTYRALVAKRERAKRALTAPLTKSLQPGNRTHGSKTKANKGRAAASGGRRRKAAAGSGQGRTRV